MRCSTTWIRIGVVHRCAARFRDRTISNLAHWGCSAGLACTRLGGSRPFYSCTRGKSFLEAENGMEVRLLARLGMTLVAWHRPITFQGCLLSECDELVFLARAQCHEFYSFHIGLL